MTTWHQAQADRRRGGPPDYGPGWHVLSDGYNKMRSLMSFGDDREAAEKYLNNIKLRQPQLFHYLLKGNEYYL